MMTAIVRFQAEGIHRWASAPERRAYLAQPHRHLFHVEVSIEVFHEERDVEFHDLLAFCREMFGTGDFGEKSCETLALNLHTGICLAYPHRHVIVSVFEDGEAGASYDG